MSSSPAVIVNKGGFLTALFKGLFGTIMVIVICGTAVGLYGMRMVDRNFSLITEGTLSTVPELIAALPAWREASKCLPPAIADALDDRYAPEYRANLAVSSRIVLRGADQDRGTVVIEVTNNGPETVSVLAVRAVVEDESVTHLLELPIYVATPFQGTCCDEWRGPLPPGETRRVAQRIRDVVGEPKLHVEVSDVRVRMSAAAAGAEDPAPVAVPAQPATADDAGEQPKAAAYKRPPANAQRV